MSVVLLLQMVVEKMLEGQGRSRQDVGREAFTQEVWKWKEQYGGFISQQMRSLGASCDWSRERFTLDTQLSGTTPEKLALAHAHFLTCSSSHQLPQGGGYSYDKFTCILNSGQQHWGAHIWLCCSVRICIVSKLGCGSTAVS